MGMRMGTEHRVTRAQTSPPGLPPLSQDVGVLVLVEERYREQAQPEGMIQALRSAGAKVTVAGDSQLPLDPLRVDVVVARGRSQALLDSLQAAEEVGMPTVDPARAVAAVRDKAVMDRRLRRAGLPVPRTWVGQGPQLACELAALPEGRLPERLIAKPVLGDNSRGVRPLSGPQELAGLTAEGGLMVQEMVPGTGADLKLYVIGTRVWATRKPSPVVECRSTDLGPVTVTPEMERIAHACGEAFGLSLYGVDCVERTGPDGVPGRIVVIEVNDFPNYTAVPDADRHLAEHVLGRAV